MINQDQTRESGQSLIIIAAVVLVLLALVALVVDVGNAYAQRRIVQNAVDAAAMAGALKLAENDPEGGSLVGEIVVWQTINDYATANGLDNDKWVAWFVDSNGVYAPDTVDQFMVPVPAWANGVEVEGQLPFGTYFAHLIGFDTMEVNAEASVFMLRGPCRTGGLFPIAVNMESFEDEEGGLPDPEVEYTLWDTEPNAPGNFGWIYWEDDEGTNHCPYDNCRQGPETTVLGPNILDTSRSGTWEKDEWVHGAPGVNFQPVLEELDRRINGTPEEQTVVIPLYYEVKRTGDNASFRIECFGAFQLTCAYSGKNHYVEADPGDCDECQSGTSSTKCVRGKFVHEVTDPFEDGCADIGIVAPSFRHPSPTVTPFP
jgi:hypothetical protein